VGVVAAELDYYCSSRMVVFEDGWQVIAWLASSARRHRVALQILPLGRLPDKAGSSRATPGKHNSEGLTSLNTALVRGLYYTLLHATMGGYRMGTPCCSNLSLQNWVVKFV
jgi:hypothetical protein